MDQLTENFDNFGLPLCEEQLQVPIKDYGKYDPKYIDAIDFGSGEDLGTPDFDHIWRVEVTTTRNTLRATIHKMNERFGGHYQWYFEHVDYSKRHPEYKTDPDNFGKADSLEASIKALKYEMKKFDKEYYFREVLHHKMTEIADEPPENYEEPLTLDSVEHLYYNDREKLGDIDIQWKVTGEIRDPFIQVNFKGWVPAKYDEKESEEELFEQWLDNLAMETELDIPKLEKLLKEEFDGFKFEIIDWQ